MTFENEIPEQCRPLCPLAGRDLLRMCLVLSKNCKGPRVVEEGEPISDEVALLPNKRAVTYEGERFNLEPQLACTNKGLRMTIEAQLEATAAEH